MKLKIYQVDAFTSEVFKGNYAAVVILDAWIDTELMQNIAFENNLSETAFILKNYAGIYEIKWFSPLTQIDFCGHATLAASFVIFKENPEKKTITFSAAAVGNIKVSMVENDFIEMVFPNQEPENINIIPHELIEALNIRPKEILKNRQAYFAIYENEEDIYNITPNLELLKTLAPFDLIVTAPSTQYDFISRYFWPANGGIEDPVTGSIHTGLVPYWAKKLNKTTLNAFQASQRGGHLKCILKDDKVVLQGQAVLYLEGYITV